MTHGFVDSLAARTQAQKFVLNRSLTVSPLSEGKLIVYQLHVSRLSRGAQFSKVVSEDFEIDFLPNLIGPIICFLEMTGSEDGRLKFDVEWIHRTGLSTLRNELR